MTNSKTGNRSRRLPRDLFHGRRSAASRPRPSAYVSSLLRDVAPEASALRPQDSFSPLAPAMVFPSGSVPDVIDVELAVPGAPPRRPHRSFPGRSRAGPSGCGRPRRPDSRDAAPAAGASTPSVPRFASSSGGTSAGAAAAACRADFPVPTCRAAPATSGWRTTRASAPTPCVTMPPRCSP